MCDVTARHRSSSFFGGERTTDRSNTARRNDFVFMSPASLRYRRATDTEDLATNPQRGDADRAVARPAETVEVDHGRTRCGFASMMGLSCPSASHPSGSKDNSGDARLQERASRLPFEEVTPMSYAETILPEFDQEMANTRKVLAQVPDDKLDWKAHPKSNTIGWNANHLAEIPGWVEGTLTKPSWEIAPVGGEPYQSPKLTSRKAILELFDKNVAAARKAIAPTTSSPTTPSPPRPRPSPRSRTKTWERRGRSWPAASRSSRCPARGSSAASSSITPFTTGRSCACICG
jgi:hypothetical protein